MRLHTRILCLIMLIILGVIILKLLAVQPGVDIRLNVLTYNRPSSLQRLLLSLNEAVYYGDKAALDIYIDRSENGTIDQGTHSVAESFVFSHGTKRVIVHPHHVGLLGQWHGCWRVSGDKEIGLILEDDVVLSPYFYRWLKRVHYKYKDCPKINGFTLMGKSMIHGMNKVKPPMLMGMGKPNLDVRQVPTTPEPVLRAPSNQSVFSYPVIGTWGFSPKSDNWRRYLDWFDSIDTKVFDPKVPHIFPYQWFYVFRINNMPERMWSMWHIYFSYINKEYTVYPNLPGNIGFSANWKEPGLNYRGAKSTGISNDLVVVWNDSYIRFPDKLMKLNYYGKVEA